MKTKKKMAALLLVTIGLALICAKTADANSVWSWDWDSCTTEGWVDATDYTIVTVEAGRNGTCGLGAQQPLGTPESSRPAVKIEGQTLDPGTLVGGEINNYFLPMTGEIYVDADRLMPAVSGIFLDLKLFNEDSYGRFICYPYLGYGSIDDLDDGWYRYHLVNVFYSEDSGVDAGFFFLEWTWEYNAAEIPVVFDNLTIAPEPTPVPVAVNIRPQCCPNPLSAVSKGMLPVVISGTNEFDVNDIEPASVSIVVNGIEISAVRHCYKDVTAPAEPCVCPESSGPDGFIDIILHFETEALLEALGDLTGVEQLELQFTGRLLDLTPIEGSDCVLICNEMLE